MMEGRRGMDEKRDRWRRYRRWVEERREEKKGVEKGIKGTRRYGKKMEC